MPHKAVRLGVEQLETREVPANISGQVFQMLDVDGIFPQPSGSFLANVPGVTVSLDGGAPISAAGGTYTFTGVAAGTHTITVHAPPGFVGFSAQSLSATLVVGASDFENLNFALTPRNSALVQNLFELMLSRSADLDGFNQQLAALTPNASNAGVVVQNLWGSTESQSLSQPIGKLITAFFPTLDIGMFRNAVQLQNLGVSQDATALQIIYSQKFVNQFGDTSDLSNAGFVNFAYQRVLLRNPSNKELNRLVSRLDSGVLNRGQLLLRLVNSPEFARTRVNPLRKVAIGLTYLGLLGREATSNQLQNRLNQLKAGKTLQFIGNQIAQSNEFQNLPGFTDTFIWDARAHQIEPAVNLLSRLQMYNPITMEFDIPVAANSISSTPANPTNAYFIAHGWAPGLTEDVLLQSTPGNPLKWWQSSDSPWLLNGTNQVSAQGIAQAIVDKDPLAKVFAYSWIDQSNTPENTRVTSFTVAGNIVEGSAIVSGVDTTNLVAGMTVTGPGMAIGAKVVSIDSATQLTLSQLATATLNGVALTYATTNLFVQTQNGTTNGTTTLTGLNTSKLTVGMAVVGTNIPLGTVIVNILSSSSVLLSNSATGSGTVALTFKGLDLDAAMKEFLLAGKSEAYTQLNGLRMASAIQQALTPGFFGITGEGLIHILGHSHGSKVATVATLALQQATVPVTQLTTLESPEAGPFVSLAGITAGVHLPAFGGAQNFLWYYMRQMNLSRTPVTGTRTATNSTFIDNYYSKQGFGAVFGGFSGLSSFGPGADNLTSIVDTELRPEVLYGGFSASNPFGAQETLFGSHDYPPAWYGQAGLQAPSAPAAMQNGLNWSPLLDAGNAAGLSEFYTQTVSFVRSGDVTNGSAVVTNIDTTSLLPGMSVIETPALLMNNNIPAGTTIQSIDIVGANGQITLSQPAGGTAPVPAESLTFTYSPAQYVPRQYELTGSARPSAAAYTPSAPTALQYAQRFTVGTVNDTGSSMTLTVGANNSQAINAITFNPLAASSSGLSGFELAGSGMDMQVQFNGPVPPGEQVELVVWIRGMVSAPRVVNPDNINEALTLGSTVGYVSIPLLALNGAETTTTQSATISLAGYLNAFPLVTGPFNSLNNANPATLLPTLGFTLLGNVSSNVSVTISNIRQFSDGIAVGP
ncbi:MAG: DUF4214 domain-containing protein [Planctomycetes bacterium]|nr:DUF4214 domain-containing protein [Planctomycetota bacterium]